MYWRTHLLQDVNGRQTNIMLRHYKHRFFYSLPPSIPFVRVDFKPFRFVQIGGPVNM